MNADVVYGLSVFVVCRGYRLWLDNDIIKDVWLEKTSFKPQIIC